MFTRRKKSQRAVSLSRASHPSQHLQPPEDTPSSNALLAASQAFAASSGNHNPNPKLSSSAAAAALKSAALQPQNPTAVIGSIPTSRMLRRKGSYSSSVGSLKCGSGNSVPRPEVQGAHGLEREESTTSLMGKRRFRNIEVGLQRGAYDSTDRGGGYGSDVGGGSGGSFNSQTSSGRRMRREKERDRERGGSLDSGVGSYSVDNPPPVPEIPHEIFTREQQSRTKYPQKQPVVVTTITTATTGIHAPRPSGSQRQRVSQRSFFYPQHLPLASGKPDCECSCSCHSNSLYYNNSRYLIDDYEVLDDLSPRSSVPLRRPSIQPHRRSAPLITTISPKVPPPAPAPSENIFRLLRTDVNPRSPPPAPPPPTSAMKQQFPWLARNGDDIMAGMSFGLLPTPTASPPESVCAERERKGSSAKSRASSVKRTRSRMKDSGMLSPPESVSPPQIRPRQGRRGSISSNNPSRSNPNFVSNVEDPVFPSPPLVGRKTGTFQQLPKMKRGQEGGLPTQDVVFPEMSRIPYTVGDGGSNPALEAATNTVEKMLEETEASDGQGEREENYDSGHGLRKGEKGDMLTEVEELEEIKGSPTVPPGVVSSQSIGAPATGLGISDTDNAVPSLTDQAPGIIESGKDDKICVSHGAQEDLQAGISQIQSLPSIPEGYETNNPEGTNEPDKEPPCEYSSSNEHDQCGLITNHKERKMLQNGYISGKALGIPTSEIPEQLPAPKLAIHPPTPKELSEPFAPSGSCDSVSRTPSNAQRLRVLSIPVIPTVLHDPPPRSVSPGKSAMKKTPSVYHVEKKLLDAFANEVSLKERKNGIFISWFKRDKGKKGKKGRLTRRKDMEVLASVEKNIASPALSDQSADEDSLKTKPHKIEATLIRPNPAPEVKEKPRMKQAPSAVHFPGEWVNTPTNQPNQPEFPMSTEPSVQRSALPSQPFPSDDDDSDSLSGSSVYEDAREELPIPSPPPALPLHILPSPQNQVLTSYVTSTNKSSPASQKRKPHSPSRPSYSRHTQASPPASLAFPSPRYALPPAEITPKTRALIDERRRQITTAKKQSKGGTPLGKSNGYVSHSDSMAGIRSPESLNSSDNSEEFRGNAHPNITSRRGKSTKGGAPATAAAYVHLNGKLPRSGEARIMAQGGFRTSSSKTTNTTPKSSSTFLGFRTSTKEKIQEKNQSMHLRFRNHPRTKFSSRLKHDSSSDDDESRDMFHGFESRLSSDSEDSEYPREIDEKTKREREEQVERLVEIIAKQKGVSLAGSSDTNMRSLYSKADIVSEAGGEDGNEAGKIGEAKKRMVIAPTARAVNHEKEQDSRDCNGHNLPKNPENYHRRPLILNEEDGEDRGEEGEDQEEEGQEEIFTRSGTIGGELDRLRKTRWTQGIFGSSKKGDDFPPPKLDEKEGHSTGGKFRRIFGGSKGK